MTTTGRKIIHLVKDGQDYYFGSVAAIYSMFTKADIGISYGSLRNYKVAVGKPYTNGKVEIKEGVIISAKGERGIKSPKKDEE